MTDKIKLVLQNLPNKPGVYRYYDKQGLLLYVGKAKVLKNRVSSYFHAKPTNGRTALMVSLVDTIEYTEVKSEQDALILEASLINNLQPKYNVKLKDDKSFVYVMYTKSDPIPGFFLVRNKNDLSAQYFGPYTNYREIDQLLKILRITFPYCTERFYKDTKCQYCAIKQCNGICNNAEKLADYVTRNQQIINVLNGNSKSAVKYLGELMQNAVLANNFSLAAYYRDSITNINSLKSKGRIVLPSPQSFDIITVMYQKMVTGELLGSFFVEQCREGSVVNVFNALMEGIGEVEELLAVFLDNYLIKNGYNYPIKVQVASFDSEYEI
jgi:excinuclease ABC subunit C